jgi:hypothetical protein
VARRCWERKPPACAPDGASSHQPDKRRKLKELKKVEEKKATECRRNMKKKQREEQEPHVFQIKERRKEAKANFKPTSFVEFKIP